MNNIVAEDIQSIVDAIRNEAPALSGKTVLITGGAGFLGSYITATLLALNKNALVRPCAIIVADNFITAPRKNEIVPESDPNLRSIRHDVRAPLPPDIRADFIIHAAGLASPYYYKKFPMETIEVAVDGTRHMLEHCRKNQVKSMLYFSSSEIYGNPDPRFIPTPEHYVGNVSSIGPRACYDESKRLGETLCMTYRELHGIPVKIVRPFNIYGPGMKVDDYRVVPTFITKALRGEPLPVHAEGIQTRTFCYVSDAVQGFFKALVRGRPGEVYNIGKDAEEITMFDLAHRMADLFPHPIKIELTAYPDSYPAGEPQRRRPDITKAKQELGYAPQVDLREGLSRTIQWYQNILLQEQGGNVA